MLEEKEMFNLLASLGGWLAIQQTENIREAIISGKFDVAYYYSLNPNWVDEGVDNGGFTPREQYALRFANKY